MTIIDLYENTLDPRPVIRSVFTRQPADCDPACNVNRRWPRRGEVKRAKLACRQSIDEESVKPQRLKVGGERGKNDNDRWKSILGDGLVPKGELGGKGIVG